MADMLQTAMDVLDSARKSYCGQDVTYRRGVTDIAVVATPQQQEFATDNLDGSVTVLIATAWLITTTDLAALVTPPQRGDKILWVQSGTTHVYEVMAPGGGPVYEDADPYRQCFKIFTKYVGTL